MLLAPGASAQGLFVDRPSDPATKGQSGSRRVEVAQRLLTRLGYYDGPVNNTLSDSTVTAIRSFQAASGLRPDGAVNDDLLRALRRVAWQKGGWAKKQAKGQDEVVGADEMREAQRYLTALNYEPGPADGTFGPQTMSAVESFQVDLNINPDGLVTRSTLGNLRRANSLKPGEIKGTLRILNWPDYIDPDLLEKFEQQTKIRVIYDTFASSDELTTRLADKERAYDIAVPSGNMVGVHAKAGLLQPLDKSKLSNLGTLDPEIIAYADTWDRGNRYSIPYMWGTTGLAVDRRQLAKRLPGVTGRSLSILFDPNLVSKLAPCGVRLIDAPDDVIPTILLWLGKDPTTTDLATIREAGPVLQRIKPYVKPISTDTFIDELASGKICAALGYSGDTLTAKERAAEEKRDIEVDYFLPSEGASLWFDMFVVPANAPNTQSAYAFLNFMLQPQVIGAATNFTGYANANKESGQYIDKKLLDNPNIVPSRDMIGKLKALPTMSDDVSREMEKIWQQFEEKQD